MPLSDLLKRGLSRNGKISLYCFCKSLSVILISFIGLVNGTLNSILCDYWLALATIYAVLIHLHLYWIYRDKGHAFKVAWRSELLGFVFGIGILTSFLSPSSWHIFGWYLSVLSLFHYSEYLTTAFINPKSLSLDSFLLNHSVEYSVAAVCSWLEFILERYYYPEIKEIRWISIFGLLLCLFGEIARKLAMFTAGTNFNHVIQSHREEGHMLVTHGIYSFCRHPSYVGWFFWSIGTQLILCNPVCLLGYTVASWRFFRERIIVEEITLLNFFGEDYIAYQRRVPTGLPFIQGYRLEM